MNLPRTRRVLGWAIRVIGRALLGASAGLIVVSMTLMIATDYLGLFAFENTAAGDRSFRNVVGLGSVAFALLAVVAGKTEIKGRAVATLKGVLAGAIIGVLVGPPLGFLAVAGIVHPENWIAFGILGGSLGAIIGGIIGFDQDALGSRKKCPGVADFGPVDGLE